MLSQIVSLLNSPQVSAFVTALVLSAIYSLVGKAGTALEALGVRRNLLVLVVVGKRLEALGYDGPKLKGQPGVDESIVAAAQNVKGAL